MTYAVIFKILNSLVQFLNTAMYILIVAILNKVLIQTHPKVESVFGQNTNSPQSSIADCCVLDTDHNGHSVEKT